MLALDLLDYYLHRLKGSDKKQGFGRIDDADVNYQGYFKDNKMHGMGRQVKKIQAFYGLFQKGKAVKGFLIKSQDDIKHQEESFYVGEFKNDKEYGYGVKWFADGSVYAGEWKFGEHSGKGTMHYPDGSRYIGEWKQNQKHGEGQMLLPDGQSKLQQNQFESYTRKDGLEWIKGIKDGTITDHGFNFSGAKFTAHA